MKLSSRSFDYSARFSVLHIGKTALVEKLIAWKRRRSASARDCVLKHQSSLTWSSVVSCDGPPTTVTAAY